jgi:glycosyltransferase involved in cell wall biosynthesis
MLLGNIPAPGGGGLEGQVYDLSRGLVERGVDVELVCADRLHMPAAQNLLTDRLRTVPFQQTEQERGHPYISNLRLSRDLAGAADWSRYDLVHMHAHYGYYTAMRLRSARGPIPALVTTFHLTPIGVLWRMMELGLPEEPDSRMDESVAMMEATVANLSDQCIAVSNVVRDDLVDRYHVPADRVTTVYNGIEADLFRPVGRRQAREALGLEPDGRYLLYIGPFDRFKGFLLLDSLERMDPEVKLVVIWPTLAPWVRERAGERIIHTGYVPKARMAMYYSACELLAFPAVYAGFGLALLEASACGCVPVVFDQSAMNEVVTPESAWKVQDISPGAYAAAVNEGMRSPQTLKKALRGIQGAGARFSEENMLDETLAVYRRALGAGSPPRNPFPLTLPTIQG